MKDVLREEHLHNEELIHESVTKEGVLNYHANYDIAGGNVAGRMTLPPVLRAWWMYKSAEKQLSKHSYSTCDV